jgi:hypothetical protein
VFPLGFLNLEDVSLRWLMFIILSLEDSLSESESNLEELEPRHTERKIPDDLIWIPAYSDI